MLIESLFYVIIIFAGLFGIIFIRKEFIENIKITIVKKTAGGFVLTTQGTTENKQGIKIPGSKDRLSPGKMHWQISKSLLGRLIRSTIVYLDENKKPTPINLNVKNLTLDSEEVDMITAYALQLRRDKEQADMGGWKSFIEKIYPIALPIVLGIILFLVLTAWTDAIAKTGEVTGGFGSAINEFSTAVKDLTDLFKGMQPIANNTLPPA